jgi:hypothetical protein
MLLIPASVEMMLLPLSTWEKRVWREAQGRLPAEDRAWYMEEFVEDRLAYATYMVAMSVRHVQECAGYKGYNRHGEQERRPEEGAFPATEGLGPQG